ncbi:MAG: tripartite tricarboxylate transporter substrate binding protein [Burkholderiales bacterium]|nr:tripartite tricarboxylate transporter substrate binding protein [Burkholderiales bacterium]
MPRATQLLALAGAFIAPSAFAADRFPERPVRFIVPFPPGGGTDAFARIVGQKLSEIWGQQVIVDNRGGAQGNIGTQTGAKANPDGYTLMLAHQGAMTINVAMYRNPGFDPIKDFTPVARGVATPNVMSCHPSVPVKSVKDLVQLALKSPGKITYASTGAHQQLTAEVFKTTAGVNMLHVPYKGAGPAVIDLVGGQVNCMFSNPTSTVPHVKAGRVNALGVIGPKRLEALPDVPNAAEFGYPDLAEYAEWYGIALPSATPAAIVAKVEAAALKALASPDVLKRLNDIGQQPSLAGSKEFTEQVKRDHALWGKLVRAAGLKVD